MPPARVPAPSAAGRSRPSPPPAAAPTAARLEAAARRSPFTRRAAVFAAVVLLVAISVAYPAQRYVAQRQHVDELRAQVAAGTTRVAALEHEKALVSKETYIEREARRRLHYVMPGDFGYRVEDPHTSTGLGARPGRGRDPRRRLVGADDELRLGRRRPGRAAAGRLPLT